MAAGLQACRKVSLRTLKIGLNRKLDSKPTYLPAATLFSITICLGVVLVSIPTNCPILNSVPGQA